VWHLSSAQEVLLISGVAFYAILLWLLKDPPPVVHATHLHKADHAHHRDLGTQVLVPAGRPADMRVVVTESIVQNTSSAGLGLAGVTVLLVEDDDDSRHMLTTSLYSSGASVVCVGSAADVIQTLEHREADVLLCDLGLADRDGFALIHRLRAVHESSIALIPAVSITASRRTQDRDHALAAGYQFHIEAPIDGIELSSAIRAAVSVADEARRGPAHRGGAGVSVRFVTN
jgi:CheY-like chemotaxis protein